MNNVKTFDQYNEINEKLNVNRVHDIDDSTKTESVCIVDTKSGNSLYVDYIGEEIYVISTGDPVAYFNSRPNWQKNDIDAVLNLRVGESYHHGFAMGSGMIVRIA